MQEQQRSIASHATFKHSSFRKCPHHNHIMLQEYKSEIRKDVYKLVLHFGLKQAEMSAIKTVTINYIYHKCQTSV